MLLRSYLGSLVLLLATVCLAFGAPAPANQTASPPQSPPAGSTVSATPAVDNDGFVRTNRYFQACKNKAAEIETVLQKLQAEARAFAPDDKAKQRTILLNMLTKIYPGSTFDGTVGTIPFQRDFVALFNSTLNVESIKEVGAITLEYLVTEGQIHLSDGINSVTIVINQTDLTRSSFINVTIPAIKEEAKNVLTDPDHKRIAAETGDSALLNDAYQLLSQTNKMRMDTFAADVIRNSRARHETLRIAVNGYRERHPEEYNGGVSTQRPMKKTATSPKQQAETRFYDSFVKLFLFIVSAAGVLWAIFAGIRALNSRPMNNAQKMQQDRYNSLSPMVTRALKKLGTSLWGRNLPWSRTYYIYQRSDRWLLCDGKEDKYNKVFRARTRVEVCLRSSYFKLRITRLNGVGVEIPLTCKNLSEKELMQRLVEITSHITNATDGIDGVEDKAVAEPAMQTEVSPASSGEPGSGRSPS